MSVPAELPAAFASLRGHDWQRVTLGKSGADVWRIDMGGGNVVFLKTGPAQALSELPGEAERLEWLAHMGLRAPRLVELVQTATRHWLLMTQVPGQDLTHETGRPEELCRMMAQGLRRLHALDPRHCPFDQSVSRQLAAGAARVEAGLVDEDDFDARHRGWSAAEVLAWVEANRPSEAELVVTHGDACLPNLMADGGRFSGIIDCGRLGLADRWQDLALACRSIMFNCGEAYVAPFLQAYGAAWDPVKYRFYNALDELF
ncbi:APH(3') family aminoglycoside O-phosphotransferase [Devosia sp.]|uniref:APH(3') family aminoglycoside O-phosphotransferase n=1 Tax=Devosia sp. TaxID=1871048 RepID=UPI002AFE1372|nr:APH(3') family aminoglycoside O-phosphotransferase [Devosia sp.]